MQRGCRADRGPNSVTLYGVRQFLHGHRDDRVSRTAMTSLRQGYQSVKEPGGAATGLGVEVGSTRW
jgi:hypothetical protein